MWLYIGRSNFKLLFRKLEILSKSTPPHVCLEWVTCTINVKQVYSMLLFYISANLVFFLTSLLVAFLNSRRMGQIYVQNFDFKLTTYNNLLWICFKNVGYVSHLTWTIPKSENFINLTVSHCSAVLNNAHVWQKKSLCRTFAVSTKCLSSFYAE